MKVNGEHYPVPSRERFFTLNARVGITELAQEEFCQFSSMKKQKLQL